MVTRRHRGSGRHVGSLSAGCQLDVLAVPVDGDEPVPRGWLIVVAPPVVGGSHLVVQIARPGLLDLVWGESPSVTAAQERTAQPHRTAVAADPSLRKPALGEQFAWR